MPREQFEALTPQQVLGEELFLGLRLLEGVDLDAIQKRHGVELGPRLQRLRDEGFVEMDGQIVRLAPARLAVSNEVFVALMG